MKPLRAWKINAPAFNSPTNAAGKCAFFNKKYTKSHDDKVKNVLGNANDINHGTYPYTTASGGSMPKNLTKYNVFTVAWNILNTVSNLRYGIFSSPYISLV
jgi:hypothetical protein